MHAPLMIRSVLLSLNLVLVGLLAFAGVNTFYDVVAADIGEQLLQRRGRVVKQAAPKENRPPFSHYRTILQRALFGRGKAPEEKKAAVPPVDALDPTGRSIRLWGTVTGRLKQPYAVIEEFRGGRKGMAHDVYHVGDTIQGAEIEKIMREKVILLADGKREVLQMEKYGDNPRRKLMKRTPIKQRKVLRRSTIEHAMGNLNQVMTQARITTHQKGLFISRIKRNSIFHRMGLKNGDIIKTVAGKRIRSVDDAMALYRRLESAARVSIELVRRGRERVISYNIR